MNGTFFLPTRLFAGVGCVRANSGAMKALGDRCLIVTGAASAKASGALDDVLAALKEQGIACTIFDGIKQNPALTDCLDAAVLGRKEGADFVVGIGGGSPLDAAKAVAVYLANPALGLMDVFDSSLWQNPARPVVAVGTTAGTGSEVTPFAVMTTPQGIKRAIAHPQCFPVLAYGDAVYTKSLSRPFTVSTALDALAHALEGYFSTAAGDISDLFAIEAAAILYRDLSALRALSPDAAIELPLRESLYRASILAGFTLAQCGTCYCHSFSYFLTEEHGVSHGTACAVYLPGFIARQSALLPDRADRLWKGIGCGADELGALVKALTGPINVTLDCAAVDALVRRMDGAANLVKTAPDGLGAEEATRILSGLFR